MTQHKPTDRGGLDSRDDSTEVPLAGQSRALPARRLTDSALDSIRSFHTSLFANTGEQKMGALKGLVRTPMVPGSYINALAKQVENYDLLKWSGLSLLDEGKELVQDARRSLREEGGVSPTHFATVRITPFLMRLEGFAREFFDIQRTAAKKWIASPDGGVLGLTTKEKTIQAAEHELQYRELEVWLSQFTVNPVVASSFIDGNRFLASLGASPEIRVTLADSGYSIQMDPSHLSAACGVVAAALRSVASSVNKRAIDNAFLNEMILKEGYCDETQESVEACKTWLGARHALFGDQRIHCGVAFRSQEPMNFILSAMLRPALAMSGMPR